MIFHLISFSQHAIAVSMFSYVQPPANAAKLAANAAKAAENAAKAAAVAANPASQTSVLGDLGTKLANFASTLKSTLGIQASTQQGARISQGYMNSFFTLGFSISMFIFVLFLILVFINYTVTPIFSFSPSEPALITIPVASDRQIAFTMGPAASDLSANFVNIPACSYTISSDVYLSGDFMASGFPRVLLYRSIQSGGVSMPTSTLPKNIASQFPDTNLIVWLDPMKNDLYVSAITNGSTGVSAVLPVPTTAGSGSAGSGSARSGSAAPTSLSTPNRVETISPIENIPIKKVFRLTIVFTQQFLEVYINGNLEKSLPFIGAPITTATKASFYPPVSAVGQNVRLANIAFWPRPLTAREVRAYGAPIANETFFFKLTAK
jgi:hypothetical protein